MPSMKDLALLELLIALFLPSAVTPPQASLLPRVPVTSPLNSLPPSLSLSPDRRPDRQRDRPVAPAFLLRQHHPDQEAPLPPGLDKIRVRLTGKKKKTPPTPHP